MSQQKSIHEAPAQILIHDLRHIVQQKLAAGSAEMVERTRAREHKFGIPKLPESVQFPKDIEEVSAWCILFIESKSG